MTIQEILNSSVTKLEKASIGTARLDALVLLEDITGKDRAHLLAHPETPVQGATLEKLNGWIVRRMKHEPLAYIRGKTEFYGREFLINNRVLEPRPESETMIELLKELVASRLSLVARKTSTRESNLIITDIGTGSGALAITAKLEMPQAEVIATDIDPNCLSVARRNAKKHHVDIAFSEGDLLNSLKLATGDWRLATIMANLPYVPDHYKINQAVAMEPRHAIFGGKDGLDLYRRLFGQLNRGERRVQFVFTESLPFQHKELAKIAKQVGYSLQKTDDFIQLFTSNE